MKKKTLCILSCLLTTPAFAHDTDCKTDMCQEFKNSVFTEKEQQDIILEELKSRGIVTNLPGINVPLVNYGVMAEELIKNGKTEKEILFVIKNVKVAFDVLEVNRVKKKTLTEILDSMGILETDARSGSTICM